MTRDVMFREFEIYIDYKDYKVRWVVADQDRNIILEINDLKIGETEIGGIETEHVEQQH